MPWSDWTRNTSRGWSRASQTNSEDIKGGEGQRSIINQRMNCLHSQQMTLGLAKIWKLSWSKIPIRGSPSRREIPPRDCRGRASSLRKPAIKGTRVPVDLALPKLARGTTAEEIANEYALTGRYTCLFGLRSRDSWRRTGPGYALNGQDPGGREQSRLELLGMEECCAIR